MQTRRLPAPAACFHKAFAARVRTATDGSSGPGSKNRRRSEEMHRFSLLPLNLANREWISPPLFRGDGKANVFALAAISLGVESC